MLRPNRNAINHPNVILRKTRRHCMSDMVAIVAKQQYRAEHLWRLCLDHQYQVREDFAKWRVSGNHLLDALLLRAKLSVILSSRNDVRRGDGRPHGRQFLSLRNSKFSLLLIGHLCLSFPRRPFYAWYVTKAILRRQRQCPLTVKVEEVQNAPNSRDNQPKKVEEKHHAFHLRIFFGKNHSAVWTTP